MTLPRLHLPHISRIFSAILWVLLIALFIANKPIAYSNDLFDVFHHPFSALAHEHLYQHLTGPVADQEQAIIAELSPVLGAATTANEQQATIDMNFWQSVTVAHPDYRDAYLQLAQLNYQNGNLLQTQANLLKAQALDPNNTTINRLMAFTSKLLE
jgi:hypothetical protein